MTTEYVITQWEQGTIDAYGNNESSSTRVRMPNYIEVSSVSNVITTFIASAEDTNGTPLKINIMMYDSNHNVVYDNGWNDSGEELEYTLNISYIRLILRYSDSRNIDPSDVGSCSVMYDNGFHWLMENNRLTNEYFLATPSKPFVGDSPYTFWRIDPNINSGMPYVGLMIGVPALAPLPTSGAFKDAVDLERATIPQSCTGFGDYAFAGTKLQSVRINAESTYAATTFPQGCEVKFYGVGDWVQLRDGQGRAVVDGRGKRVFVKGG